MATSNSSSKLGAVVTLAIIVVVIGGLTVAAFQLSRGLNTASQNTDQTAQQTQSPDLQNINDQFDDL